MPRLQRTGKDTYSNWIYRVGEYEIRPAYNALNRNFTMRREGWTATSLVTGKQLTLMDWADVKEFANEYEA